jgi:hypothetical protein
MWIYFKILENEKEKVLFDRDMKRQEAEAAAKANLPQLAPSRYRA